METRVPKRSLIESSWADVEALRTGAMERHPPTVQQAAQLFVEDFGRSFRSVVLGRLFLVLPFERLPPAEAARATAALHGAAPGRAFQVLSLLGTWGRQAAWCDRRASRGHLAVPLLDQAHVQEVPMIAKLLSDLQVDFAGLDDGRPIASQRMLGGLNGKFFVSDALTAIDSRGRFVIPARDFVTTYGVRTVFGMGGAYVDGTLAVCVFFTDELVDSVVVDRFPSLISNFKMGTAPLLAQGHIYAPE
jgi:hypothetical protein